VFEHSEFLTYRYFVQFVLRLVIQRVLRQIEVVGFKSRLTKFALMKSGAGLRGYLDRSNSYSQRNQRPKTKTHQKKNYWL